MIEFTHLPTLPNMTNFSFLPHPQVELAFYPYVTDHIETIASQARKDMVLKKQEASEKKEQLEKM
jgi:hypothetical protein